MKNCKVATVTLTWNAEKDIRDLLGCIEKQSIKPDEIIIVDNNSTDNTAEIIREYPYVKFFRLDKNYGYAKGYNIAFSKVSGDIDYVIALDHDVLIDKDHVRTVAERFEKEPESTIIITGDVEEPLIRTLAIEEGYVNDFHGSCFSFRNIHRKYIRFSEEFFGYNNESDLSARLLDKGFKILFYPNYRVFHKKDTTRVTPFTTYYMTRNSIWHFWRNARLIDAVLGSFVMAVVFYSKASRNRTLPSYFHALFDAVRGLAFCIRTRKPSKYVSYKDIHDLKFIRKKLFYRR